MTEDQQTPFPPKVRSTLFLYDEAKPTVTLVEAVRTAIPHVAVEIDEAGFSLAAWTPSTLRRFADICNDAAYLLEQEIARQAAAAASDAA